MKLAEESTEVLSNKLVTGGGVWAVDIFPFCASLSLENPGVGLSKFHSEASPFLVPWCWVQTILGRVEGAD